MAYGSIWVRSRGRTCWRLVRTREYLPVSPPLQKQDQYTGKRNEINKIIIPNGYSFERVPAPEKTARAKKESTLARNRKDAPLVPSPRKQTAQRKNPLLQKPQGWATRPPSATQRIGFYSTRTHLTARWFISLSFSMRAKSAFRLPRSSRRIEQMISTRSEGSAVWP